MDLHKAAFERVYGHRYSIDATDEAIIAGIKNAWIDRTSKLIEPTVGEFLLTDQGYLRFTHDWGEVIQTTVKPGYDQSFHIDKEGFMSFSGSLDPAIDKTRLVLTSEIREGSCWFWSHGYVEGHNGVHTYMPCRVWAIQ